MIADRWWEGDMLAFDLETTGVDVHNDRIVTAALVELRPGHRPATRSWLINPGIDIPAEAAAIHGVTTDKARTDGMVPAQALFEVSGLIALALANATPVVAFNAAFDLTTLEAENQRHRQPTLVSRLGKRGITPIVDPFVIDKAKSRRRGSRKLVDQCAHYRVTLAGAHSSAGDALAAARLVPVMVRAYPELGAMTLTEVHRHQVVWRREQMQSLREYFDSKGIAHDGCAPGWPLMQPVARPEQVPA